MATLYLRDVIEGGDIVRGSYKDKNHTFPLIDGNTVVDITADQYGGPKIYVGLLRKPWQT
ncbi:MAG: hypothetical protein AABX90_02415 [Nanoarchaeota archaeon]